MLNHPRYHHYQRFLVRQSVRGLAYLACALSLVALSAVSAQAEELVWATGRILDPGGKPMAGAVVAVYDDNNKVVDYARTDPSGEYALALPPRALHLERKHGRGFIAEVFTGVTRFVGGAAEFVANPLRAGVRAVTSSQAANFADPLTKGEIAAGGVVIDRLLFAATPHTRRAAPLEERKQPGALLIKVIAPDRNDLVGVSHIYWLEQETFKAGGKQKKTLAAWLDPIQLTSADSDQPSKIDTNLLRFASARLEPSLAEVGQTVRITARMPLPEDPTIYVVVIARNNRTGEKWELRRNNDGYFEGEFEVTKKFPHDDQVISLIAYAAKEQRPERRQDAERAIEGAGYWDLKKPYVFNPLLVVSRNRADMTLTVVQPSKKRR